MRQPRCHAVIAFLAALLLPGAALADSGMQVSRLPLW